MSKAEHADKTSSKRDKLFGNFTEPDGDLRKRSVQSAAITGGSRATILILRLGTTAILARILTPSDYGLIAMTTIIVGFFNIFSDAGLSSATIQKREITHAQISTLFWINIALGLALTISIASISPIVAWFYGEERLMAVTLALSLSFTIGSIAVQHQALLRRQMRFSSLAVAEIAATAGGVTIAIIMAKNGLTYWALVGLTLGTSSLNTIAIWCMVRWIPSRPRRGTGVTSMLRFGGDVLGFNLVNYLARNADNMLIGRYLGTASLGFYEKAYSLLLLPIGQINGPLGSVSIPALSRLQDNPERFQQYFLKAIQLVSSITLPIILCLSIFSNEIVLFWLGEGWESSSQLFKLLSIGAIGGAFSNPLGWLLVALGKTKKYRTIGAINSFALVTAFVIGLPYGASGVAIAYSVLSCISFLPSWWYTLRGTPVQLSKALKVFLAPVTSGIIAGVPSYLITQIDSPYFQHVTILISGALVFSALYLTMLLIVFKQAPLFIQLVKDLRPSKKSA